MIPYLMDLSSTQACTDRLNTSKSLYVCTMYSVQSVYGPVLLLTLTLRTDTNYQPYRSVKGQVWMCTD